MVDDLGPEGVSPVTKSLVYPGTAKLLVTSGRRAGGISLRYCCYGIGRICKGSSRATSRLQGVHVCRK
jgi:hypothetical protein